MNTEELTELLVDEVKDIYDAEKQLVKALPKMAKACDSEELAEAIRKHLGETQNQVVRLEKVFQLLKVPAKGKPCKAMKGLLEEGAEALEDHDEGPMRDLAIIASAQRVEHYEMSAYGTAVALAEHVGNAQIMKLLQQTQAEEVAADEKLTEVAKAIYSYEEPAEEGEEEEEEEKQPAMAGRAPGRSRSSSGR